MLTRKGPLIVIMAKWTGCRCVVTESRRLGDPGTSEVLDGRAAGGEELLRTNAVVYRRRLGDALYLPETCLHLPAGRTGKA